MCGICGIVTASPANEPTAALIQQMRDKLIHRGPDDADMYLAPGIGLGHRRLSIIDVAHGRQPMHSDDGRFVIIYNGEVFNHPELKPELERMGQRFRTTSDTETVLRLFELQGTACVQKLRGMFAFAIWDSKERRLFLARDRFGVKPLYYTHQPDGTLIFGSEVKALLPALRARPALNLRALPDYLANHAPSGEETLFDGIKRLPPGHTMTWQDGRIRIEQYWDLPTGGIGADTTSVPRRRLVEEFTERFTEAVRIRLMSDVPLGVFLSGGIDSAAITAVMAGLISEPVRSFSVAFQDRSANELSYARLVSQQYRTEHREILVTPEQFFQELPRLIWHEDEPLAHPSSVPLYFVAKLAAEHVKVVLTGEGSDELLAGYNRYRVTEYNTRLGALYEHCVPGAARRAVRRTLQTLSPGSRLRQIASRTFLMRGLDLGELYFDNFAVFPRSALPRLLSPRIAERLAETDPYAAHRSRLAAVSGKPLLSRLLYADAGTYLQELLMKQDQMSMAASVESRVPFLDHPLAEWVSGLDESLKLRGSTTKWILRRAMQGRLPPAILDRRKMGFPVPIGTWLRERWRPLLDEYITGPRARDRGLFNPAAAAALIQEHQAGINHSERLWSLLNFEIWARIHLDGEEVQRMPLPLPLAA